MDLETKALVDNYKVAATGQAQLAWMDRNIITRVLSHRAEREASKFLKKEFHMRKAEEGKLKRLMGKVRLVDATGGRR